LLVSSGLLERKLLRDRPEYRLTARGLATYPYALSLMKWGDDWLAGKDGPPVILKHKACGIFWNRRPFAELASAT